MDDDPPTIKAGLKRAVAQGVKLGRPKIDSATERKVRKQLAKGFSSRPHPRKCGVKRFLVVRGVAGAVSGVACFWATSLEKIIGGVIAIISFRSGGIMLALTIALFLWPCTTLSASTRHGTLMKKAPDVPGL